MFWEEKKQKVTMLVIERQFLSHLAKIFGGVAHIFDQEIYI